MTSINDKIRAILETRLSGISGIPDIAWENVKYSPTTGQPFVQPIFIPTQQRPAVRGTNPVIRYQGIFSVYCYSPEGNGPSAADDLADLIINNFPPTADLTDSTNYVTLEFAQRQQGTLKSPWYIVPVDIDWYSYK